MSDRPRKKPSVKRRASDADEPPSRRRPIRADESASEAVVAAVATAESVEPTELPPLGDRLDTDDLDGLLDADGEPAGVGLVFTRTEDIQTSVEVSFQYADYAVTVSETHVVLE